MYHEVDFRTLYWAAHKCRQAGINKTFYNVTIDDMAEHGLLDVIVKFPNRKCTPHAVLNAARNTHLPVLRYLRLRGMEFWASNILDAAATGDLDVVKYLYEVAFEDGKLPIVLSNSTAMMMAAMNGHYKVVKYLYRTGMVCPGHVIDFAAGKGHFKIVKFLRSVGKECSGFGLRVASENGNLEMVKYLVAEAKVEVDQRCITQAIQGGSLEVVEYLISSVITISDKFSETDASILENIDVIGTAAQKGHLNIIKYFYERGVPISSKAISNAASSGDFETVRYLYKQIGICPAGAIDYAIIYGHLKIAWFLLSQGGDCTVDAMNFAAKHGNFNMVRYLHAKGKSCTTDAIDFAARYGHFKIVKWLRRNRTEWCTHAAMYGAAIERRLKIVKWLHNHGAPCSPDIVEHVIEDGNLDILKYLHSIKKKFSAEASMKAAKHDRLEVLQWMYDNELVDMEALTNSEHFGFHTFETAEWIYEHNGNVVSLESIRLLRNHESFDVADWLEGKLKN